MSLFLRYLFPLEKFSHIPKRSLRFAEEVSFLEIQFLFSNLYDDFFRPRASMKSHLLFHSVSCSVSMYLAVRDISGLCLPHLIFSCAASVSPEAAAFLWTASRVAFISVLCLPCPARHCLHCIPCEFAVPGLTSDRTPTGLADSLRHEVPSWLRGQSSKSTVKFF